MKYHYVIILQLLICTFVKSVLAVELVRSADEMVESIGVCTHWAYKDTPYGTQFATAKQLLDGLGVRYIRDRFTLPNIEIYNDLGIQTTAIIIPEMDYYLNLIRQRPEAVVAIEGPNETNIWPVSYKGYTTFPQSTRMFQNDLYDIVKNDPLLNQIPVIATSTAYMGNNTPLAPLTSFDFGVIHSYPNGMIPSGLARRLDNAYKLVGIGNNAKHIIATEAGYHTAYGLADEAHQGVTPQARSKYTLRLLAEYFNQGVVRTHLYEFVCTHEHMNSHGKRAEAKFGLVSYDMVPTPSYIVLKNYLHILDDSQTPFEVQALDMNLNTSAQNVHHTLLQKSDGTYFLLIWNDVSVYHVALDDPLYGTDIINSDVPVEIVLPDLPVIDIQVYRPSVSGQPISTIAVSNRFELSVPDEMLMVSFKLPQRPVVVVASPVQISATATDYTVALQWQVPQEHLKGYFVYRMGQCIGFTEQSIWQDTVTLLGVGYTYGIQAVDQSGNLSPIVEHIVMTQSQFSDLVVEDVSWEPAWVNEGDAVTFKATIKNVGQFPSPTITHGVAFRINGKIVSWFDQRHDPMMPGESLDVIANNGPDGDNLWIAESGVFEVTVHVDDQDRFREENDLNNKLIKTIAVHAAVPENPN